MAEYRLFEEGTIPEYTTPEWYKGRDRAMHIDEEMHRPRLELAARMVTELCLAHGYRSLSDLGGGDGGLLSLLKEQMPLLRTWGYDLQESNVTPAQNEREVDIRFGDVVTGDVEYGEIAACTEFLEHLLDPHGFVRRLSKKVSAVVASSPWTESLGNAYAFHTWAWDTEGYRQLFEANGFKVVSQQQTGMFQVLTAEAL